MNAHSGSPGPALAESVQSALTQAVHDRYEQTIEELMNLVRIPGIAWDSYDPLALEQSANYVSRLLREAGMEEVQILREHKSDGTLGGPAVVGRRRAAEGFPTVMLYAHHDVQPPGEATSWVSPPFEPSIREQRLWGRGAADDKAGVLAHIAAFRAVSQVLGQAMGVGVTLFIEGEEEAGSPTFDKFLEKYHDWLQADVIVVADSGNWRVGTPALTTSLRGVLDGVVQVRVLEHSVHSGMFGGPVLDAPTQLARLLATMHNADGTVAIAGLHRGTEPDIDYSETAFLQDAGVIEGLELAGRGSISSRLWTQPALSVIGIDCVPIATSSNTIIPEARAKISLRIAPGQEPERAMEALEEHIRRHTPATAEVRFLRGEQGKPFTTKLEAPGARTMLWSLERAWGVSPVAAGMGGSIPFVASLVERYPTTEILITGVEDPDSRAHSTNESLHLGDFQHAIVAEALFLATCAHDSRVASER